MSGAAKVLFSLTNLTSVVSNVSTGITFVQGMAERGPFSDASEIINSWPQFVAKYGGLLPYTDTPLLCKRLLEKGGMIRFSRVGHYTDVTNPSTLTATKGKVLSNTKVTLNDELTTGQVIEATVNGVTLADINYSIDTYTTVKKLAAEIKQHPDVDTVTTTNHNGEGFVIYVTPKVEINSDTNFITTEPYTSTPKTLTIAIVVTGTPEVPTFTIGSTSGILNTDSEAMFNVTPKNLGYDTNNITVLITPTNNEVENSFNMYVNHRTEPTLNESYTNLVVDSSKNYLQKVMANSALVDVEYLDTLTISSPVSTLVNFHGGTDGTIPQQSDYVGDSNGKNGFHAFDEYYDSFYLTTFDDVDVDNLGVSYCSQRGDLAYVIHLSGVTKQSLLTEKREKNIDDKHAYFIGGQLKINDPFTGAIRTIKETADVLAIASASDTNFGPWYSFAGPNRGMISGVLGVGVNFGSPANYKDLDELANNNINMVINRDGSTKLWGNFSGQMRNNQERYFNVVKLVFFIKKALRPILETFLEEPNDIPTWSNMYYTVKPLFDNLKDKRAIYNYKWDGDQHATNMQDLKINKASDVTQGKYKVILSLSAINSLQEIQVGIVLTDAGVEFQLINNN